MSTLTQQRHDPQIRLVIFDLGRVLVRICDSWDEAYLRSGLGTPSAELDTPALREISLRHDIGDLSAAGFAEAVSPHVRLTPEQVHGLSHAYLHGPYPGGAELIDELHANGLATACLSNTNDSHWRIMNDPSHIAHFPLHRLTYRFASHLIRARKPDPAIYAHVEQQTGVSPEAIIFFDDMEANIAAANARGWNAHHVDPKSPDPIAWMRSELRGHGIRV